MNKKLLASILLTPIIISCTITYAATTLIAERQVSNTVTVSLPRDLQLFSDTGCTQVLTSISWGDLSRGDAIVYGDVDPSMYIKNIGEASITVNYTVTDLPSHLTLTARKLQGTWSNWNPDDIITLDVGDKVPVEWTLSVAEDAPESSTNFGIDVLGWKP